MTLMMDEIMRQKGDDQKEPLCKSGYYAKEVYFEGKQIFNITCCEMKNANCSFLLIYNNLF